LGEIFTELGWQLETLAQYVTSSRTHTHTHTTRSQHFNLLSFQLFKKSQEKKSQSPFKLLNKKLSLCCRIDSRKGVVTGGREKRSTLEV